MNNSSFFTRIGSRFIFDCFTHGSKVDEILLKSTFYRADRSDGREANCERLPVYRYNTYIRNSR
jgi:hypothetical protein